MAAWTTSVEAKGPEVRLLVEATGGCDVLKARLPKQPGHPRALLTLLEGLALWKGEPLCAVISVDGAWESLLGGDPLGLEAHPWPTESALVHFMFAVPRERGRRLDGLGDFRDVRRLGAGS